MLVGHYLYGQRTFRPFVNIKRKKKAQRRGEMEDAVAAAVAVAVGIAVQRAAALLLCWRLAFFLNISVRERESERGRHTECV